MSPPPGNSALMGAKKRNLDGEWGRWETRLSVNFMTLSQYIQGKKRSNGIKFTRCVSRSNYSGIYMGALWLGQQRKQHQKAPKNIFDSVLIDFDLQSISNIPEKVKKVKKEQSTQAVQWFRDYFVFTRRCLKKLLADVVIFLSTTASQHTHF